VNHAPAHRERALIHEGRGEPVAQPATTRKKREVVAKRRVGLGVRAAQATDMSRARWKDEMTSLTLEDLEAVRQHYGIAQEEEEDLLEDLGQVGRLEEVGMRLERWAQLRGVPMEYAEALREYLDQEE
jgi:hypothetical protein